MGVYDAVVVGGGPAGSAAALRLSRLGAHVLLLEKQRIGRDKPCGGGLTPRAQELLPAPIDDLVLTRVDAVDLLGDGDEHIRMHLGNSRVLMVRRAAFDARLMETACSEGVHLHDREPVTSMRNDRAGVSVETTRATYRSHTLLLATGAEAPLRSSLRLNTGVDTLAVALEIEGPATARRLAPNRIVFDYRVPGGYAWVFPKGDIWNVGILSTRRDVGPRLRGMLMDFIARAGVAFDAPVAVRVRGHRIPLHTTSRTLARGRVALLGDAAGLADAFYGEGIAQALLSGRLAADAVLQCLNGDAAALFRYQRRLDRSMGRHSRRMRFIARGVYRKPGLATAMLRMPPVRRAAVNVAMESFDDAG
jgi:geranylgeranyl reductase family protein